MKPSVIASSPIQLTEPTEIKGIPIGTDIPMTINFYALQNNPE